MSSVPAIVLFHYYHSPYAHKIIWYLHLRSIPYKQCLQPHLMPRPDLSSLGISYRRIPLLSIGNEVFCDTAVIIRELEARFPRGRLGGRSGWEEWEERSNGVFTSGTRLIPSGLPWMRDPRFIKDREDYSGRSYKKEDVDAGRQEALGKIRESFGFIEANVLSDGRDWILGDGGVSLADVQAVWPLEWLNSLPGALDSTITAQTFPRTFAWIKRFTALLPAPKTARIPTIKGPEAKEIILGCSNASSPSADNYAPSGLAHGEGEEVEVTPVDTGRNHPQRGRLRALGNERIILEVTPTGEYVGGGKSLRVIFPRKGYEIRSLSAKRDAKI